MHSFDIQCHLCRLETPTLNSTNALLGSNPNLLDYQGTATECGLQLFSWHKCQQNQPLILVYNRIPKAGSTTMIKLVKELSQRNGFQVVIPRSYNYTAANIAILDAIAAKRKTFIVNHFKFPEIFVDDEIGYINVMRHPVDRCISWYYYSRYAHSYRTFALQKRGNDTLDECVSKPENERKVCLNCIQDVQARFFCGRADGKCQGAPLEYVFERAKRNINLHYFVGLAEAYEETVASLELAYPDFFKGAKEILAETSPRNVMKKRSEYVYPSEETRKFLAGWLDHEIYLYNYAASKFYDYHRKCVAG